MAGEPKRILFVCTGNTCRSPMAEALLQRELRGQDGFTVESAGLGALVGHPASEHSVALMDELDLDISGHRARQIHPDMVSEADLVLGMKPGHRTLSNGSERIFPPLEMKTPLYALVMGSGRI